MNIKAFDAFKIQNTNYDIILLDMKKYKNIQKKREKK